MKTKPIGTCCIVWRCADTKGRPPVVTESAKVTGNWRRGICVECNQPVWLQRHSENRLLICWPCAELLGVV